jgi:hypothetical protein
MAQLWTIITSIVDENCASSSVDLSFRDLQRVSVAAAAVNAQSAAIAAELTQLPRAFER